MDSEVHLLIEQLAASVAREFARINQRFDAVDVRFDAVDKRFDALENRFDALENRFDQFEQRTHADIAGVRHDIALLFARERGSR